MAMMPQAFVIGILLDDVMIADWLYVALAPLVKSEAVERVVLLLTDAEGAVAPASSAYRFFDAIDARLSRKLMPGDAFAQRDIRELFPQADIFCFHSRLQVGIHHLQESDRARIASMQCGLLIRASKGGWEPGLGAAARWGLWSWQFGDPQRVRGGPPGFHECINRLPTSGATLEMCTAEGRRSVVDSVVTTTYFYSPRVNRHLLERSASSLLSRQIERLYRLGEQRFFAELARRNPPYGFYAYPEYRAPGARGILRVWLIYVLRILRKALSDRLQWEKWHLLVSHASADADHLARYTEIAAPPGEYWADPFLWSHDGKTFVFMEVFSRERQKGHLAVAELGAGGSLSAPVTILDAPYHLSYPCLVEHAGSLYMIPESKDNHAVSLYRCAEFPYQWEFVMHLMEGVSAVDATPFYHQGRWWLFMTVVDAAGGRARENLCLFHADALLTQRWIPHPLNPVVTDARYARPAGHIRVEGQRIFRPAQDCSHIYGHALAFREIKTLSVDDYEEVACETINPAWSPGLIGTHTFSRLGEWTVMDVCRRVFNHPGLQRFVERWRQ